MLKTIQTLFVLLAVFAVGVMQAVGVQAGYLCGCTGQQAATADCLAAACHPTPAPVDVCGHDHGEGCGSHEHGSGQPSENQDHKHTEVRGSFVVTTFPPGVALPPVLCFVLPPAFELPELVMVVAAPEAVPLPLRPPDDTGPPMCLLVAETTVLLV